MNVRRVKLDSHVMSPCLNFLIGEYRYWPPLKRMYHKRARYYFIQDWEEGSDGMCLNLWFKGLLSGVLGSVHEQRGPVAVSVCRGRVISLPLVCSEKSVPWIDGSAYWFSHNVGPSVSHKASILPYWLNSRCLLWSLILMGLKAGLFEMVRGYKEQWENRPLR